MTHWPVLTHYDGAHVRRISMPVGGIGTGFFCLGGRGQLSEWQLMSRPHRGWRPRYAHLVLRTEQPGRTARTLLRVLESSAEEELDADFGAPGTLMGVPRFRKAAFEASYPFGRCLLSDPDTPVAMSIEAFNPLIPGDVANSSLPFGLITLDLRNTSAAPVRPGVTLLLTNFVGDDGYTAETKGCVSERVSISGWSGLHYTQTPHARSPRWGDLVALCDAHDARAARRWAFQDGPWNQEPMAITDNLLSQGFIPDADESGPCPPSGDAGWHGSLSALLPEIGPGATGQVRFLVAWRFPYRDLSQGGWWNTTPGQEPIQPNFYAAQFDSAASAARSIIPRLEDLQNRTAAFVSSVVDRPAPREMREAALFNLTPLRTHTSFRLEDGTFMGWEGCGPGDGCCIGSCTHVWNYEEATLRLFPELHRSMLEAHLAHGATQSGGERFRLTLPLVNPTWGGAAADGQMGLITRVYAQYLADGADAGLSWLKRWYPTVKRLIQFAWLPGGWDADRDGVMEGAQHNTYDVEFFGPNPLCTVWYLAALSAGAAMAEAMGDGGFATELHALRKQGAQWVDNNLYNGRYYVQRIEAPPTDAAPMTELTGEAANPHPRFQLGAGCLVDQLVGQYKANRNGLGDLLDRVHIRQTLQSIFKYNHYRSLRDHYNNMRTFATPDDAGTIICSYPDGGRPEQPFPYFGECMTGFEYQLAVLLLDYDMRDEAAAVASAVRNRHDGRKQNPFNEPECGSFYARCMAAWALLDAWDKSPRA